MRMCARWWSVGRLTVGTSIVAVMCLAGRSASAQAWVPAKGDGSVEFDYQNFDSPGHLNFLGQKIGGPTVSHTVLFGAEYGITDRAALTVALPYIAAKYTGEGPACPNCVTSPFEFHISHLDDGAYHGTMQDFRIGFRYNVINRAFLLTPSLTMIVPSHHYENEGEAAVGRRFFEAQLGLNAGRDLGPLLPRAFAQGRYSYTLVPKELGVSLNRSNVILDLEYSLRDSLVVRGVSTWQWTHGGLPGFPAFSTSELLLQHHDRLLHDNNWRAGGGVVCSLGATVELSATVISVISGTGTHRGTGITIGFTRYFNRQQILASIEKPALARHVRTAAARMPSFGSIE
jgi:hypothetical protein